MDKATLDRALGVLPLAVTPTTPQQLAALGQAMSELTDEIHAQTDEMDGLSSRLALIAAALTGTAAAAQRMAQHARDEARAQMSTREHLINSERDGAIDGPVAEAIQEKAGEPSGDRCPGCGSLLPAGGVGWLCAPCELVADGQAEIEGASVASAGAAGPTPLDSFEVLPSADPDVHAGYHTPATNYRTQEWVR